MSTDRYLGHIRHLRERLWVPGTHGRAAVLVGAGFSRNAQAVYADAPEFALLSNYVEQFAHALGRDLNDAKFIPIDRLAEEYESSFGREALDDVIQRLIPWTSYRPGELHRKLLRLPWADIFTTNYDPLLEQARSLVPDRRYDLVVHPDDLPTARRPRILKLHGSFPSSRPFIFTEEDFRQYPQRFAPFVNAVQQGMLENTLCLIGFQGDDPNFLRWAGWIRDELGPHRPLIYLVNILNLNDARRRYLESRQIIPIDLGEILEFKNGTPASERYRMANDWFLESLQNGRPENLLDWPEISREARAVNHTPPPVQPVRARTRKIMSQDVYSPAQLYLYWRERRETYPKWEVFPAKNHYRLEHDSPPGERHAIGSVQGLPAPLNLLLLREVVWRYTLQNAPLDPALSKVVTDTLHTFMPLITHQAAEEGQLTADDITQLKIPAEWTPDGKEQPVDMATLRPTWIELAFAALTSYRLYLDIESFTNWSNLLKDHLHLAHFPDWEAQWHWEQVRLSIDLLNLEEAEARIKSWPLNPENPFWEIRRAAALGELGLIEKARGSFNSALERLRAGLLPGEPNPRLLSQFAWALRLRWFLDDWLEEAMPELEEGIEDKEGLWRLGIDTWADTKFWKSTLLEKHRKVSNAADKQEFHRNFDVGKGTRTFTVSASGESQGDPLLALRFLRFLEWAASPLMVGQRTFGTEELQPALLLLSHPYTYPLAVLLTIRTADANTLNGLMSRERIAALPDEHINLLIDTLFESIQQALSKAAGTEVNLREDQFHLVRHVLELGVEALSRLLLRASSERIEEAYELALKLAGTPAVQLDWSFYESVSSLITRTLDRWSPSQAQDLVADLAAFPLPGDDSLNERWPIPLLHPVFGTLRRDTNTPRWVPAPVVQHLIGLVNGGSDNHRRIASLTLYRLFEMHALNEKEAKHYGDALWQRVDERSKLPTHTGLYEFTVVDIPTSKGPEVSTRFKNYYLKNILFSGFLDAGVIRSRGGTVEELDHGLSSLLRSVTRQDDEQSPPLDWSAQEIALLFDNIKKWWVDWEQYVIETSELSRQFHTERLERITQKIVQVLYRLTLLLSPVSAGPIKEFSQLVQRRMNDWGFIVTPDSQEDRKAAAESVVLNLLSNSDRLVEQAIWDAATLIRDEDNQILRQLLIHRIIDRASPGLDTALRAVTYLMTMPVQVFCGDDLELVLTSLDYLSEETQLKLENMTVLRQEARTARSDIRAAASNFIKELVRHANAPDIKLIYLDNYPTIQKWMAIGQSDPLPEVRQPWERSRGE